MASWGMYLLDTRYFTQWLEHMIAYSIRYFYWCMHLWLIWSTLYIVNTVIYYIWWSYIVFQRNYVGRHISVKFYFQQKLLFSLSLHLISSYIYILLMYTILLQIPLHYYITSRVSTPHFHISVTLVTYQSPVLGNFTVDLSRILRILYFIYPN